MSPSFAPDDADKPFVARWNLLVRILLVPPSVKHIARAAMDYADFQDGSSCHPSNARLARETGYSTRTIQDAWSVMRGLGMAVRVADAVSYRRLADEYQLTIPDSWSGLPILGPHGQDFACVNCGNRFTPVGNYSINERPDDERGSDTITFDLVPMCFCPAKRKEPVPVCQSVWDQQQKAAGSPTWAQLGQERWKLFARARGDDW